MIGQIFGTDSDYRIKNGNLKWLDPVLRQWLHINRDYIELASCTDSLYCYNERANISVLAGAVWQCGGFALEEYVAEKGKGNGRTNGRVDLFFSFANKDVIVEAKQKWIGLGSKTKDFEDIIKKVMEKADDDIERTMKANVADYAFGISFLVPYWKAGFESAECMENLKKCIKKYECDFWGWFNLTSDEDIKYEDTEGKDEYIYNSVILIGKLHK